MRVLSVLGALALIILVLLFWPDLHGRAEFARLCLFVSERIYLDSQETEAWGRSCLNESRRFNSQNISELKKSIRSQFSKLAVSHLDLFDPKDVRELWSEERTTTGLKSEFMDGQLIITKIIEGSPGELQGVQMGDRILLLDDETPDPSTLESRGGDLRIERSGKEFKIRVEPVEFTENQTPSVEKVSRRTAVFKIPSFRQEYFEKNHLETLRDQLMTSEKIILDLRKNEGGNFVAGLRLLSMFFCGPQEIGYLLRPRFPQEPHQFLSDDLEDAKQLEILNQSFRVTLKTFPDYPCLNQSLAVLVDHESASTAEMVAQALRDYRGAAIFGELSSGQLLVGVWYPWNSLGEGVKLSVPEAIYQTKRGHRIEQRGVELTANLTYRRQDFVQGQDSWVLQALQKF